MGSIFKKLNARRVGGDIYGECNFLYFFKKGGTEIGKKIRPYRSVHMTFPGYTDVEVSLP